MLDRLSGMTAFVRAADLGSFTAAGSALGMTSQMVGKHVAALERRLGTPLLYRSTRSQRLTDAGQRFYERCRAILDAVKAAEDEAQGARGTVAGRLRVTAPVGFGAAALAPLVLDLTERHAELDIELILTDRYVDPVAEGFDAIIRLGPLADTSLSAIRLIDHDQVACAAPRYLATHGTPTAPADLAAHVCLGFINASGRPFAEWRFGRAGTITAVSPRTRFRTNDGRVLVAAAVAGHGILLQPRAVVAQALARGELVSILEDHVAPSRPMYLLCSPQAPTPARLTMFVDAVTASFGHRS